MNQTPEPWTIGGDGADIFARGTPPNYADAIHIADCQPEEPGLLGMRCRDVANASRIIVCVNALKGIDDPEAMMKQWHIDQERERRAPGR